MRRRPRRSAQLSLDPEWDRWEVYLTPGPVAEQGLLVARQVLRVRPQALVDVGFGTGVFGQRAALVFPRARRLGIEVRTSEVAAARHYHDVHWGSFLEPAAMRFVRVARPSLLVSNPPFSRVRQLLELAHELLPPHAWILLLVRDTWGGAEADEEELRRRPPSAEFRIPGRLRMRVGKGRSGRQLGGDNCGHSWLAFRAGRRGPPIWPRILLPPLPGQLLRWSQSPGTEERVLPLPVHLWPEPMESSWLSTSVA